MIVQDDGAFVSYQNATTRSGCVMVMEKQVLIKKLTEVLAKAPVKFAILYGSYAADRATPVSDIDLAVYAASMNDYLQVVAEVDAQFPAHHIDLVNLHGKPALLYYEVLAGGVPLLIRDDAFYQQEKLRVMRDYLDYKPMHDRLLQDMRQRIEEGTYGRRAS